MPATGVPTATSVSPTIRELSFGSVVSGVADGVTMSLREAVEDGHPGVVVEMRRRPNHEKLPQVVKYDETTREFVYTLGLSNSVAKGLRELLNQLDLD